MKQLEMTAGKDITEFLTRHVEAGDFPSAVFLVGKGGETVFRGAVGNAVVIPEIIAADVNTIYDLASLTKPLVTALLTAIAIERRLIGENDTTGHYFKDCEAGIAKIPIRGLAAHISGLPAWLPLYLLAANPDDAIRHILHIKTGGVHEVIYSDLNYILLGSILEKVFEMPIGKAAAEFIFRPLGLQDVMFRPNENLRPRIAASETGNRYEEQACREKFPDLRIPNGVFRERLIWGEVHDANAWFLGGEAGHAGLFGTVDAVFAIAKQFLPRLTSLLDPAHCSIFRKNLTEGFNEARSFGFQMAFSPDSTAGSKLSPNAFGHTGFTGTSLWIEPESETVFILLTNRTHNRPLPFANINAVRRRFHEIAAQSLD
ncbi:MAG: serine hydrolase domain-containing protein [Pyrinomonadaceae bacterium]